MAETALWRWHVFAMALYAAASVAFIDHGVSLTGNVLGPEMILLRLSGFWPGGRLRYRIITIRSGRI